MALYKYTSLPFLFLTLAVNAGLFTVATSCGDSWWRCVVQTVGSVSSFSFPNKNHKIDVNITSSLYTFSKIFRSFYAFTNRQFWQRHFWLFIRRIDSSGQILLPRCLINSLSSLNKTHREYSTNYILEVKGQGHSRLSRWRGIHVDAGASQSIFLLCAAFWFQGWAFMTKSSVLCLQYCMKLRVDCFLISGESTELQGRQWCQRSAVADSFGCKRSQFDWSYSRSACWTSAEFCTRTPGHWASSSHWTNTVSSERHDSDNSWILLLT